MLLLRMKQELSFDFDSLRNRMELGMEKFLVKSSKILKI